MAVYVFEVIDGGNWMIGFAVATGIGMGLGFVNATLIHVFKIITIVVTIATFNAFFGLLMFFASGWILYNLPDWWTRRIIIFGHQTANGTWAKLTLPVVVLLGAMAATWFLFNQTSTRRQLYAFWDNSRLRGALPKVAI